MRLVYTKIRSDISKEYDVNLNISLFKSISCNDSRFPFINYSLASCIYSKE